MRARIPKKEREYFIENLSMLLLSGMGISSALSAIQAEIHSSAGKKTIENLKNSLLDGTPLSKVLGDTNFFSTSGIALIRLGEQSGTLAESIKIVASDDAKERMFRSRIRSAMIYPVFVLILAFVVGIGVAWFVLPKLSRVFGQMNIVLPFLTRALIGFGEFLQQNGVVVIPLVVIGLLILFFFLFVFSGTKRIGEFLLLKLPGISKLIKEMQIARFGSTLGTMLGAGIPILDSLRSLQGSAFFYRYKKLFKAIEIGVSEGKTISTTLQEIKRSGTLIPIPIQQLIRAGEQSGSLPESLKKVGEIFEAKTEVSTKNFAVLVEPILLVLVWFGVLFVALAVFLPLYSLLGGLQR